MNQKLKETLNAAYSLCDALEKTDSWDKANTAAARDIFRGELFHFLINLSFADGKISQEESKFIKDYLDYDFSIKEIREYAIANRVYGANFSTTVPYCFKAFVKADNNMAQVKDSSSLILNLYRRLGQEFIGCDGSKSAEKYALESYCENMSLYKDKTFVDTVNLSFGALSEKTQAISLPVIKTVPANSLTEEKAQEQAQQRQRQEKEPTMEELLEDMNSLVGLEQVKRDVNSLINLVKIRNIRKERGMESPAMSLHMVFSGNPGTGKTTIARLLAGIYKSMGLLSKGHLTEVDRSGLVGGYVGQTALKVKEVCDKAKGGVLFIDEAYSLTVNRGATDFGFEAVDTLLKYMEDMRDDMIVIVAGYPRPMEEFLQSNPGLKSRFNKYLYFDDYSPEELIAILNSMAAKSGLDLNEEAEKFSKEFFTKRCENKPENYANARDVRNFFEKALVNQANRLAALESVDNQQLSTLEKSDFDTILL